MLEDNTGVQRLYIAYGLGGIIVLWLAFGFGAQVGLHQTFLPNIIPHFFSCCCYPPMTMRMAARLPARLVEVDLLRTVDWLFFRTLHTLDT